MDTLKKLFLTVNLAAYAAYVVGFGIAPRALAARLGTHFTTPDALADFRATYAGLCVGGAALLWRGMRDPAWTHPAVVYATLCAGGLGLGRLTTALTEGPVTAFTWAMMATEFATVVLGAMLLRRDEAVLPATLKTA